MGSDGCSSNCMQVEDGYTCPTAGACTEICGDGYHMGTLACDDKNTVSGDGCTNLCVLELGWSCGGGNRAKFDLCDEVCGDGRSVHSYTEHGNMCDDGNNWIGDGCNQNCVVEFGYTCTGGDPYTPDTCYETCGDGYNMGVN